MACLCKDAFGNPSLACFGTCDSVMNERIQKSKDDVFRDPMQGFSELILSQIEKRIAYRMAELTIKFERSQIDLYQKAYKEGLKDGIAIGIDLYQKY